MNQVLSRWMDDFCAEHGGQWWTEPRLTGAETEPVVFDGNQSLNQALTVTWKTIAAKTMAGGDIATIVRWPIHEHDLDSEFMMNGLSKHLLRKQTELLPRVRQIASEQSSHAIWDTIRRRSDG